MNKFYTGARVVWGSDFSPDGLVLGDLGEITAITHDGLDIWVKWDKLDQSHVFDPRWFYIKGDLNEKIYHSTKTKDPFSS